VLRRDDVAGMSGGVTVRATVADPALLDGTAPGARVTFTYETRRPGGTRLVRLARADAATLTHDHTPHHGGVVAMVGARHVEARADATGRVDVWLTDFFRHPLPLDGVRGTATFDGPGARPIALAPDGDALVGRGDALGGERVGVWIALTPADGPLAAEFTLPLVAGVSGVAAVAQTTCTPAATPGPRCTIAFGQAISALAISPDGATLVVAAVGAGVSVWRLSAGTLVGGVDPAPPVAVPAGEPPHPEVASDVVWRPDGREVAVVVENRVLRYAMPDGRLARALPGPGGLLRSAAWWPDGSRLLVTAFHDDAAHAIDAESGAAGARYAIGAEGAAAIVEPGGATVLVGSDIGTLVRFRASDGARLATFAAGNDAVVSVARADDAILSLTMEGIVRALDADRGRWRTATTVGFTPARFAVGPSERVAVGLPSGEVTIVDTAAGTRVRTLAGAGLQILAVAWHERTLVTGDAGGRVAVWDVAP
jgi:DNA-binding beta-propeller fold protein YncE